mgnify:CR=1 FL=1
MPLGASVTCSITNDDIAPKLHLRKVVVNDNGGIASVAPDGRALGFLPLPDPEYLAFRLETQYGSDAAPETHDVVSFLRWCRDESRRAHHGTHG